MLINILHRAYQFKDMLIIILAYNKYIITYIQRLIQLNNFKKLLLSSFMVAGAAIGSGVLALPLVAAGPGVVNTILFISCTFILAYVMASVSIDVYSRYDNHDVNAATLAIDFFGKKGYWITTILNVLSMGSLAAAYVNVGGDLLVKTVLPLVGISIPSQVGMIIFFVVFMPAFVVGLGLISRLNGIIFTIKFLCLGIGILLGISLIKPEIFEFNPSNVKYLGSAASTMFCIWMMHMVLPLVLKINDWNPVRAKKAVMIGMVIPALAYLGWMLLIFSLIPREKFAELSTIGDVIHFALSRPEVPNLISSLIGIFSAITVLTAFLSIGFSLIAFVIDALKWQNTPKSRLLSTIISFIIPVFIALIFPKGFLIIYQQSNMFQIAAALIPVVAAYAYNKKHGLTLTPQIIILLLGGLIILSQLLDNLSIFPIFH